MPGTSFDDVLVVNPSRITPASPEVVAAVESTLELTLPSGYADFATRLGAGSLGHFVWVGDVVAVPAQSKEWRQRITDYWFWDVADSGATPEALQANGVLLASSFDGDELCFDPAEPETLFVLPRNEDVVIRVGPGFLGALDWMLSGTLNTWVEGWTFEAPQGRTEVREALEGRRTADAVRALTSLSGHAIEHGEKWTFFLPSIEGRLALSDDEYDGPSFHLHFDEAADPDAVDEVLRAARGA